MVFEPERVISEPDSLQHQYSESDAGSRRKKYIYSGWMDCSKARGCDKIMVTGWYRANHTLSASRST